MRKNGTKRFDKSRRENITYVEANMDNNNSINYQDLDVNKEKDEICMTELQPGPPYTYLMLKLEEKHKFPNSKYNFNVTKANKIFDVLLNDKQIVLSDDHKIPSFEQIKGKRYCKFHNVFGHWTNSCLCFRDVVKKSN